jgi:serine/threonine-protein kinase
MHCPSCSADLPIGSRFCLSCGQAVGPVSQATTAMAAGVGAVAAGVGRLISSGSIPVGGLTPGTVLATRYRIIGLLGRGGMGEVYRADDLKLGQPVALKFLPAALSSDPVRRERFFAEVRITRQLAHPNICRVYDIAEVNGQHFLSMEFIDGEDLASLLKRIGYLPNEKALDITRQLLAGLAAAHERGVLHRDLKPANIMLDGHGRVRITDFGLAIATDEDQPVGDGSGTPAYMAPEQLAGKGATVRSDIYALGLVLYEILSGKKAFTSLTIAALREEKEQSTPTAPSELRAGIDPVVERLVLRCLERDPRSRPASVAQLAAALPGGDPLAAAIAAGETPSPELVAASGQKEGLRPIVAVVVLAFVVAGALVVMAMNRRTMLIQRIAPGKPPDVLVERAREIIRRVGYVAEPADRAYGFLYDTDAIEYFANSHDGQMRLEDPDAYAPITFWYRQSPRPLERSRVFNWAGVTSGDPPLQFSGEVLVTLDGQGHLKRLEAIPPEARATPRPARLPDWSVLFAESGFEISTWTAAEPGWNPASFADAQAAWSGALAPATDIPGRIEAAAYQGRPISFRIISPWTRSTRDNAPSIEARQKVFFGMSILVGLVIIGGGVFFARHNLRLGRGDRRGALRLMLFGLCVSQTAWLLSEHHVPTSWEVLLVLLGFSLNLFFAALTGVVYIALEPFVRRRWPQMLVSWTRALTGQWRDPLVGRDVLIGCAAGIALACFLRMEAIVPAWFGHAQGSQGTPSIDSLIGPLAFMTTVLTNLAGNALLVPVAILFTLFFLRTILRKDWLAVVVYVVLTALTRPGAALQSNAPFYVGLLVVVEQVMLFLMLQRFGLLALMATAFVVQVFNDFPMTFQASAWYAGYGYAALAVVGAIALYGFKTSLGGRPILASPAFED